MLHQNSDKNQIAFGRKFFPHAQLINYIQVYLHMSYVFCWAKVYEIALCLWLKHSLKTAFGAKELGQWLMYLLCVQEDKCSGTKDQCKC